MSERVSAWGSGEKKGRKKLSIAHLEVVFERVPHKRLAEQEVGDVLLHLLELGGVFDVLSNHPRDEGAVVGHLLLGPDVRIVQHVPVP